MPWPKGKPRSLQTCRKIGEGNRGKKRTAKMRERYSKSKKGKKNPAWNGGRTIRAGYIYLLRPDHPEANRHGYVAEHRLVMEHHLGRRPREGECVHHINGVLSDNRIENLRLFASQSEHMAHHHAIGDIFHGA